MSDPGREASRVGPANVLELLVVDDERAVRDWLRTSFERQGHHVTVTGDPDEALTLAIPGRFDMVLLDVELAPGFDGYRLCRILRSRANMVPIIMLTGRRAEADAVRGLEAGADDYVTKPFGLAELNSRIRAVLRRTGDRREPVPVRTVGRLDLDSDRREVSLDDEPVHLTFSEFQLLAALIERPGTVHTREALMEAIWGDSAHRDLRGIDVHVRHLREKLGDGLITTIRGGGYRLEGEGLEPAASS